jgi:DNA-binding protein HU-beta
MPVIMASKATMSNLVEIVAKETGMSARDARKAVKASFEGVGKLLKKNDRVTVAGVGSFVKTKRPAQKGGKKATNPFTGEEYVTKAKPASMKLKFRPAKSFKGHYGG